MQKVKVCLLATNDSYCRNLTHALEEIGCNIVLSTGSLDHLKTIAAHCKSLAPEILILDGDNPSAEEMLLEAFEFETIKKVIEHSSKNNGLGDIHAPKIGILSESINTLCQAVKSLTEQLVSA